ncbi:MAG: hypothetical protein ACT4OJ_05510 [Bacteroidota bacterium]
MMRPRFAFIGLLLYVHASAQSPTQLISADGKIIGALSDVNGAIITTVRSTNVEGQYWLGGEWNKGTVYFKKGKRADSLLLQFDLTANKIYFKQDAFTLAFLEEVEAFRFYPAGEVIPDDMFFRCGYPSHGQQDPGSFYELMADGPSFHLLKYRSAKITETYVYNAPPRRNYTSSGELYLYNAGNGELRKTKPDKKAILKLLPSFSEKIDSLCRKYKWELKTEPELVQLVKALNKE